MRMTWKWSPMTTPSLCLSCIGAWTCFLPPNFFPMVLQPIRGRTRNVVTWLINALHRVGHWAGLTGRLTGGLPMDVSNSGGREHPCKAATEPKGRGLGGLQFERTNGMGRMDARGETGTGGSCGLGLLKRNVSLLWPYHGDSSIPWTIILDSSWTKPRVVNESASQSDCSRLPLSTRPLPGQSGCYRPGAATLRHQLLQLLSPPAPRPP